MHELAVTENILNIACKHAQTARAIKVSGIHLVIGQLSSIIDDSVQFYWDIISRETICAGAVLHFQRVAAEVLCLECGHTYTIPEMLTSCPRCGSIRVKVVAGEEFLLESIDIEAAQEQT